MDTTPDSAANPAEYLKSLGLTRYEALVYIALLKVEGATASEIHEASGVPRASVYPVLDRLGAKNLVSISHTTPRRFNATPPEEGIGYLLRTIKDDAERAIEALNAIYQQRTVAEHGTGELIWSICGEDKIQDRLSELIASAEQELLIIARSSFLKGHILALLEQLDPLVTVEINTDSWSETLKRPMTVRTFPRLPVHIMKDKIEKYDMGGIFLIDGRKVVVVLGGNEFAPTAIYSESPGFYRFFMQYYTVVRSIMGEGN